MQKKIEITMATSTKMAVVKHKKKYNNKKNNNKNNSRQSKNKQKIKICNNQENKNR